MQPFKYFHRPLPEHDLLQNDQRKQELLKMMIHILDEMGYSKTVQKLTTESDMRIDEGPVRHFRKELIDGKWDKALVALDKAEITDEQRKKIIFLINEQKYITLILNHNFNDALLLLRNELVKNGWQEDRLKRLSTILVCSSPQEIEEMLGVKLESYTTGQRLFQAIQEECDLQATPDNRLYALGYQLLSCKYHNSSQTNFGLLDDHVCEVEGYPSRAYLGFSERSDEVCIVKFSNKGDLCATITRGGELCIWEFGGQGLTPKLKHKIPQIHEMQINSLNWSPNDRTMLTASSDKKIRIWDVETGTLKTTLSGHHDAVWSVVWVPGSQNFISGGEDDYMIIWNSKGEEVTRLTSSKVTELFVSSDGRRLYVVCASEPKIIVVDLMTQTEIAEIVEKSTICSAALSKNGKYLLTHIFNPNSELHLWDLEKLELIRTYNTHSKENFKLGFCFGGISDQFIAFGNDDGTIKIWHTSQSDPLAVLQNHRSVVNSLSWHPKNHQILISASDDRTLCIWVSERLHMRLKKGIKQGAKSDEAMALENEKVYEDLLYDMDETV